MFQKYTLLLGLFISTFGIAQNLQSPSDFLGYEIGTQFSRHADVVRYFEHVAQNSNLVSYQEYGKTNERRPLTYAIVTSAVNHNNLETIRKANLGQIGLGSSTSFNSRGEKAIVWLSYNVHGNDCLLYTSPSPRDRG